MNWRNEYVVLVEEQSVGRLLGHSEFVGLGLGSKVT